ncbi:MAG: Asp-tRNA(Asn)/Glu-tRNA(Gln) amidotransferase subunit GatB [Candidatus Gracilibacteria bacterium]|nr:Asp-tRNA(Asn)/Glu-tRNA(Gln) amidotransferase subunit GatB [Candidatus Gracilibacteria bacterium]MDD5179623.1 Asp-tRNA(Asn)/Glu-tRNA(Gln) amidotransferase subunit GatB [Candidatus Gracilibacteria bacterium]
MELEVIIGLEIHAQVKTKTKMFCSCDNDAWGEEPNATVCPVCTGHPGALPVPNKKAIELGVKAALALGCNIPQYSKFDRKNYFYPDLPAGYQISQFDEPVSKNGSVEIILDGEKRKIGITRLHLENDAGKLTHSGNFSYCDYNRAGTPLMEIVSDPDIRSAKEAKLYAEEVQKILQFVDASNADMYRGEMRFDASISLRPVGDEKLYPRAEIKNLNSFKALEAALLHEISRQTEMWETGKPPASEQTVGWNDEKGETYLMREKESAADYRYFPEPDIPPLEFDEKEIEQWRKELPELPLPMRERFEKEYGVTQQESETLTSSKALASYFEEVVKISGDGKKSAGWLLSELLAKIKDSEDLTIETQKITAENLGNLVKLIVNGEISGKIGKEIFPEMWETGEAVEKIIERKGLKQISDTGEIEKLVDKVIAENPAQVAGFKAGKVQLLGFFVGNVLKLSGGQANPQIVNQLLKEKLQ